MSCTASFSVLLIRRTFATKQMKSSYRPLHLDFCRLICCRLISDRPICRRFLRLCSCLRVKGLYRLLHIQRTPCVLCRRLATISSQLIPTRESWKSMTSWVLSHIQPSFGAVPACGGTASWQGSLPIWSSRIAHRRWITLRPRQERLKCWLPLSVAYCHGGRSISWVQNYFGKGVFSFAPLHSTLFTLSPLHLLFPRGTCVL